MRDGTQEEQEKRLQMLQDSERFVEHVMAVLQAETEHDGLYPGATPEAANASAVLFSLGEHCLQTGIGSPEPCLVFNKRSMEVRQPGDLCFPGGRISPRLDRWMSNFLGLPFFPLARWPYWSRWRKGKGREARRLSLLLATSLREGLEEMRVNPFAVRFLGPLPSQNLQMFTRVIYPMAGWIRQRRFFPNWEVEKIVYIPVRDLLNPDLYACYRLTMEVASDGERQGGVVDFPCFRYRNEQDNEVLWGATYRMVMVFLDLVFGFRPPEIRGLPVIRGSLNERYFSRGR